MNIKEISLKWKSAVFCWFNCRVALRSAVFTAAQIRPGASWLLDNFLRPQGAFPPGFYPLSRGGWVHCPAPEVPLTRGIADGAEGIFGKLRARVGYGPAPGPTQKRPCAIHARKVGRCIKYRSILLMSDWWTSSSLFFIKIIWLPPNRLIPLRLDFRNLEQYLHIIFSKITIPTKYIAPLQGYSVSSRSKSKFSTIKDVRIFSTDIHHHHLVVPSATDIHDPFSPPLSIVRRFRQVLVATPRILTELL